MASYTEKLKLLKKDPILDGDDTFNIETMLNENWDKIDEKVGELDNKSSNIKAEDIKLSDGKTVEDGITEALNKAQQAFQSASDGKQVVATAITGKGVPTSGSDTFGKMATNIDAITTDPSIGTTNAAAADILLGKKAISQGQLITGTIPVILPSIGDTVAPASVSVVGGGAHMKLTLNAFYKGVEWIRSPQPDLISANVKAGANIMGVAGKPSVVDTADATIPDSSWLLSGASAYRNGIKINGSMPNYGAIQVYAGTQGAVSYIPAGYHNGSGFVQSYLANLVAGNVKAGVDVGGVVGNLAGMSSATVSTESLSASKTYTIAAGETALIMLAPTSASMNRVGMSISGIGFTLLQNGPFLYTFTGTGTSITYNHNGMSVATAITLIRIKG